MQWLRLEALWQPGSQVFPSKVTGWTGNGTLCRLYLCISMGLLEPFCLFTAVLLCRSVLRWVAQTPTPPPQPPLIPTVPDMFVISERPACIIPNSAM